jgi:two-component system, cell cycle sensor histidine kinase and response regulator CckA
MDIMEDDLIDSHLIDNSSYHGTVLIVDDEEAICSITKLMIENAGFRGLTALDGMEAIRIMSEMAGKVDCILLDHSMPNMNGNETFKLLKTMFPSVKVVMMSGYALAEIEESLIEKGLAGYIQKPYTQAVLIRTITDAMNTK